MKVSFAEYEAVREHPAQFFNTPRHEAEPKGHARVVDANELRVVVEKTGRAAQVAKEFDTRTDR